MRRVLLINSYSFPVYVLHNGTLVNNGTLIYYDEISSGTTSSDVSEILEFDGSFRFEPNTGALFCGSHDSTKIRWHYPNGTWIDYSRLLTFRTRDDAFPYYARVQRITNDDDRISPRTEGLWTCRHNGNIGGAVHVGVYQRGRMFIA
jgi:hypothetical protein